MATMFLCISLIQLGYSKGRWVQVDDKWKYEAHEGTKDYVTDRFRTMFEDGITEKVYYFDYYGYMVTGPAVIDGGLYIFSENGDAVTTGYDIDGVHYNTDGKGKVLGLPAFFDYSKYKTVATELSINMNIVSDNKTIYDDQNIMPTASAQ